MYRRIKRALDVVASLGCLVVLSPLFVVIPIVIKLGSKGPAFFKQLRYGKNEVEFEILKFRTMRIDAPQLPPSKFENSTKYITPLGAILRKTSLDELPQLLNVLKGDMSFVGPRPGACKNEQDLYEERKRRGVFSIQPGITGWAQVNGRDVLAHDIVEKSNFDEYYTQNLSFKMDMICLLRTFYTVGLGAGYEEGVKKNRMDLI